MSKSISITGEFLLRDCMSDLGLRFAESPLHRIHFDIVDADVDTLAETYRAHIFRTRRTAAPDKLHWYRLLLRFDETTFLFAAGDGAEWAHIYAATEERAVALHTEVVAKLRATRPAEAPFFYMLRYEACEFLTERVEHLPDDPGEEFLQLCYGQDIALWFEQFAGRTADRPGGLTILEGPPGTGKTSLLSVMMRRLEKSHVFYVLQASQDNTLSAPELVPFWQAQNKRHPDRVKVIVIEDAERLLWPRNGTNREAVSTVLNIADGLIGRMLRLHIICSVNARLNELDPAIMRPGRLMNQRAFRPLPRHTAQQLADLRELPFQYSEDREEFALAEVLNPGAEAPTAKPQIGFAR
ncbi:MAG TPA: AAA family ATPase [Chthoniobacter sp.]|nr:AAA family ATPase [Chthoniobacter sp.]